MPHIVDIGKRIELIPLDTHFHDITIGLYHQQALNDSTSEQTSLFLVHTYSHIAGAAGRIADIKRTMQTLGGMLETPTGLLYFPCGDAHQAACRRIFLEAGKIAQETNVEPRPLQTIDKKSQLAITVSSNGNGLYAVKADGEGKGARRRTAAIAAGLVKLGEMNNTRTDSIGTVAFDCGHTHDALVGLLLVRAPNVRVALREEEMNASRGVLAAPSRHV